MKNFVQHGKTIETVAGGAIASGAIVVVGATAGVAAEHMLLAKLLWLT